MRSKKQLFIDLGIIIILSGTYGVLANHFAPNTPLWLRACIGGTIGFGYCILTFKFRK